MPLLWRMLIKDFLKVFFLIILVFVSILLVSRSAEIARFASLGTPPLTITLFTVYQIPYILPIAIPISAIISAFILTQKMSQQSELTALRSMGIPPSEIALPLYLIGTCLSLCNVFITSEITPYTRMLSKELIYNSTTINPLILLQKDKLLKLKNSYVNMQSLTAARKAQDVLFAMYDPDEKRLKLISANQLTLLDDKLVAKNLSFITTMESKRPEEFDHLVIENDEEVVFDRDIFSHLVQSHSWTLNHEYLTLKNLFISLKFDNFPSIGAKRRTQFEVIRRMFLSLAPITFTVLGVSFGFYVGRYRRKRGIVYACTLASFTLICFLVGRSFQSSTYVALVLFLFPHPICITLAILHQKRMSRGIT